EIGDKNCGEQKNDIPLSGNEMFSGRSKRSTRIQSTQQIGCNCFWICCLSGNGWQHQWPWAARLYTISLETGAPFHVFQARSDTQSLGRQRGLPPLNFKQCSPTNVRLAAEKGPLARPSE